MPQQSIIDQFLLQISGVSGRKASRFKSGSRFFDLLSSRRGMFWFLGNKRSWEDNYSVNVIWYAQYTT